MLNIAEARDNLENIVKEMRLEMEKVNERILYTEEKLIKSQHLLEKTQYELKEAQQELNAKSF